MFYTWIAMPSKSYKRYERLKSKKHRGHHRGGPRNPDYERGQAQGEVKAWSRPLSKYDVKQEARKGRTEIISKKGFTEGAIMYTKRYRPKMKLFHGNRRKA